MPGHKKLFLHNSVVSRSQNVVPDEMHDLPANLPLPEYQYAAPHSAASRVVTGNRLDAGAFEFE